MRYYYIGKFNQINYFLNDYISKPKYKVIDYQGEFGPELKYVLPFAYWHYKNGTLEKTISSKDTKEFYFFSNNHEERYDKRKWIRYVPDIPNSEDHNIKYNLTKWLQVPLKQHYKNDIFQFEKPVLIIANRYQTEWGKDPITFLDFNFLRWCFGKYRQKYQIIYNRPIGKIVINDNSEIVSLPGEKELKKEFPDVLFMTDLYQNYNTRIHNYNHLQLLVYANAERFISTHGGTSVLASYFGGMNIIYSKKGHEHYFDEFNKFYPKLSGAKINFVDNLSDLKNEALKYF